MTLLLAIVLFCGLSYWLHRGIACFIIHWQWMPY